MASLSTAYQAYADAGSDSAWNLHRAVAKPVQEKLATQNIVPLAAAFGPAMLEAAVVDGVCRKTKQPFAAALRNGTLGLSAEDAALLPASLNFIHLRHTVGLADALSPFDGKEPLDDGLPETLEGVIHTYHPVYYKVKMSGDAEESLARLRRVAEILDRLAGNYRVTLDGNEQFEDMETFAQFWERLRGVVKLKGFLNRLLWIEQPVRREAALDPSSESGLDRIAVPVILDESDGEEDALDRGLILGYSGISSKTCKGLFRSVSHFLRLKREEAYGRKNLILSSEDLTTVPVHPLQQDLCLAAALGLSHSERNGHHYIRGFEFLSPAERADALKEYPSLYEPDARDGRVRIADGGFHLAEVNAAHGFGSHSLPDWKASQSVDFDSSSASVSQGGSP